MGLIVAIILIVIAFVTSVITAIVGLGGGILLLACMSMFVEPLLLIPLHGVVQLASNGTRAILTREAINWRITFAYCPGALLGAIAGYFIVVKIPEDALGIILGSFIIVTTWLPRLRFAPHFRGEFFFLGATNTFLSLFVGATGPYVAPFFERALSDKDALVSTTAITQAWSHTLKLAVFGAVLQEALAAHGPLMTGMVVAAFLGTAIGKRIFDRIPERAFRVMFRITVTVLAAWLIVKSVM